MDIIENNQISSFEITKKAGFTSFSERLNGKVAMMGFVILFMVEAITKKSLFEMF